MDSDPPLRYVTASLHVDYLKPTPIDGELELRGRVKEIKGRKVIVETTVYAAGVATARGEVVAVQMPKTFIGGTVYDPAKNEVIEGATVTLSGDTSAATKTNGWGDFYFEGLEEGTYKVEIKAGGKTKLFDAVSTKENSANLGDLAL